eukprot:ANDGO_00118.mRNA.1 hypothetical protein
MHRKLSILLVVAVIAVTASATLEQCTEEFVTLVELHNSILETSMVTLPSIAADPKHACNSDLKRLSDPLYSLAQTDKSAAVRDWNAHFDHLNEAVRLLSKVFSNESCGMGHVLGQSHQFMKTLFKAIPGACRDSVSGAHDVASLVEKVYGTTGGWKVPHGDFENGVTFSILGKDTAVHILAAIAADSHHAPDKHADREWHFVGRHHGQPRGHSPHDPSGDYADDENANTGDSQDHDPQDDRRRWSNMVHC